MKEHQQIEWKESWRDEYMRWICGFAIAQVEQTMALLYFKYLKAYISYEGLQRVETFLFPHAAIREALLNAVVHKDYSSGIPIQISVYDNKIVIWGSGQLPPDWTLERLLGKHPSAPYNPLIAHAFFRAGYIESWGRGIEKISDECRIHNIQPPIYDASMSGLMLSFHANNLAVKLASGKPSEKPSEKTSEKILALMKANDTITIAEIAVALSKTPRSIEMQIAKLKATGTLERIGADKGGHWKIVGENNA
jgi:ATP-dependent DNA helicase RecG